MTESTRWYAHSDPDGLTPDTPGAKWQTLREHLHNVGDMARRQAVDIGADADFQNRAYWTGLLHDLGKYQSAFQDRLTASSRGAPAPQVPHAAHGAAAVYMRSSRARDVMLAIAGHHAGLANPTEDSQGTRSLRVRISDAMPALARIEAAASADGISLPGSQDFNYPNIPKAQESDALLKQELETRMLASLLIHADRLDSSGRPYRTVGIREPRQHLDRLTKYVETLAQEKQGISDPALLVLRQETFAAAVAAGAGSSRLLEFQVPTGGGKTLAALALSLSRAAASERPQRVIYVLPFLSLIEQNAQVWRDRLAGDGELAAVPVLEHHSGAKEKAAMVREGTGKKGQQSDNDMTYEIRSNDVACEDWESPVVITTAVRLFETLFGSNTSSLRRFRALAGSILIFDEIQTLPRELIAPFLSVIRSLSDTWGMTIVSLTATPPAFETARKPGRNPTTGEEKTRDRWRIGDMTPVLSDAAKHYGLVRRVTWHWPSVVDQKIVATSWADVTSQMAQQKQALLIVNLRKHARTAISLLEVRLNVEPGNVSTADGTLFHLSTTMCGAHRMAVLAMVRQRLQSGLPCCLVSTQLVEAGVDLDFPTVWRAIAPLDSLIQAAGRCNREGRLGLGGGSVYIFEPLREKEGEILTPRGSYEAGADLTRRLIIAGGLDPDNPSQARAYFDSHYDGHNDDRRVQALRQQLDFPAVAQAGRLIDSEGETVLVPWGDVGHSLVDDASRGYPLGRDWWRKAQPYLINLWPQDMREAQRTGSVLSSPNNEGLYFVQRDQYADTLGFTGTTPSLIF